MLGSILLLVSVSFLVLGILDHYGNRRKTQWFVGITTFLSWIFPFSIIIILPLDLSSTGYRKLCSNPTPDNKILCDEPLVYVSVDFLVGFWQTLYWTMFCLTWFIIPILQSWMRSGEITFKKRFLAAVRENVIFYVVAGVIGAILLLYIYFAGNYEPGL